MMTNHFWALNCPEREFFQKNHYDNFMYLLVSLTVENLQKDPLSGSRIITMHNYVAQNG